MSKINIGIEIDEVIADGLIDYLEVGLADEEAQSAALVVLLTVANALPKEIVEALR